MALIQTKETNWAQCEGCEISACL